MGGTPRVRGQRLLLGGGLLLLAFVVYEVGVVAVELRQVGVGVVPIVLQEILAYTANTAGWRASFPALPPSLGFRRLLAVRIAGDAVNYLTPTATLGGEFVRGAMLRGHAPASALVASVTVAKLAQTVGLIAFVAVGLATIVDHSLLPDHVRTALTGALGVLAVVVGLLVVVQRRGMFVPIVRLVDERLGVTRIRTSRHRMQAIDDAIRQVHAGGSIRFWLSAASFGLGFALGTVESYLVLWFLGVPVTIERALTVEVLSVAFNNALFFVPWRAGTQEAGKVLIFESLGLDPAKGLARASSIAFARWCGRWWECPSYSSIARPFARRRRRICRVRRKGLRERFPRPYARLLRQLAQRVGPAGGGDRRTSGRRGHAIGARHGHP